MSDQPSKAGGDWENPHERGVQAKDASNEKDGQTEKRQEQKPSHDAEPKGCSPSPNVFRHVSCTC
jgi:hypothetical protein